MFKKEDLEGWKEYTEPKKMVKLYQYAYEIDPKNWIATEQFYISEADLIQDLEPELKLKRLDYTMIEVEDV